MQTIVGDVRILNIWYTPTELYRRETFVSATNPENAAEIGTTSIQESFFICRNDQHDWSSVHTASAQGAQPTCTSPMATFRSNPTYVNAKWITVNVST